MHAGTHGCVLQQVEEDRFKEMLDRSDSESIARSYFKPRRASVLLGGNAAKGHGKSSDRMNAVQAPLQHQLQQK